MIIKLVPSENPENDQWRLLLKYGYTTNIERFFRETSNQNSETKTCEFVSGSILQAESYFESADSSSLHIKPLLLYYGTVNLLAGAATLLRAETPSIDHHGMKLILPETDTFRIGDVMIKPINPKTGALQQLANVFSDNCDLTNGDVWSLEEILGSLPDLLIEFENCYQDAKPFTIPIEVVKMQRSSLERIYPESLSRFSDQAQVFFDVHRFSEVYLQPQWGAFIILRKRVSVGSLDLGAYSISGRKHLQVGHKKQGRLLTPSLLMLMLMGSFALGFLSRYHPEIWNPFVRSDSTGERLLIDRFLSICKRHVPNLVLNAIIGQDIRFVNEQDGVLDLTTSLQEGDLKELIAEQVQKYIETRRGSIV